MELTGKLLDRLCIFEPLFQALYTYTYMRYYNKNM